MTNPSMSRIRGHVQYGPGKLAGALDQKSPGESSAQALNAVVHPLARLSSTESKCLASQRIGLNRISLAWDGYFCGAPQGRLAEHLTRLYRLRGFPGCLPYLQGDYALSLYDESARTLFLVRDRIGIRPLYYVATKEWLAFSSQPLCLTAWPGVGREPNRVFLGLYAGCHYRTFDNDPHASPYRHVQQLPAGHWLRWCAGTWEIQRYWDLSDRGDFGDSEKELAAQYRKMLFHAVQRRLPAAKKPGFLLSGGMDSSSVLSAAVQLTRTKQRAFSSTYADTAYDESGEIRTILNAKVSRWSNVLVEQKSVFATIQRMVKIHEEPVATATWLSHYEVCRRASAEGIQCLFTGLGGDELNAGEYEHFIFFFADLCRQGKRKVLRKEIQAWRKNHDHPVFKKNHTIAIKLMRERTDPSIRGLVRPDHNLYFRYHRCLNPDFFDLDLFYPTLDRIFSDSLKNRCYQDIFRETAPCCLRAQDRHGYTFGLPHHNPFYDVDLVEFMFRIPGTLKIQNGITKHLLREAMKGILPESTRTRVKKTGWNAPAHLWFSGKNSAVLKDMVRSRVLQNTGIYRILETDKIIDSHQATVLSKKAKENHMMFLWQLANLYFWLHDLKE